MCNDQWWKMALSQKIRQSVFNYDLVLWSHLLELSPEEDASHFKTGQCMGRSQLQEIPISHIATVKLCI
jgi:hypothetical protein